jgi:hypothetical protein
VLDITRQDTHDTDPADASSATTTPKEPRGNVFECHTLRGDQRPWPGSVSAAWALRLIEPRSSGSPGTQFIT